MKKLLLIFAMCALAAAMVPRERRAVNTEEEEERLRTETSSTTTTAPKICSRDTPCAWSTYRPSSKIIEVNLTNSYCVCSPDTVCQVNEDDTAINAYIYRCRPPSSESEDIIDS